MIAAHPHDHRIYTQGLVWAPGDVLFESSGGYGESAISRRPLASAQASVVVPLADDLFGEGLAVVEDRLVQLTWREGLAVVYRASDLAEIERIPYRGEGWGLTYDGSRLIMSDGTHVLTFRDPRTLEPLRRLEVRKRGAPQDRLNELEWVDGQVYANVYQTDEIVIIDPESGRVDASIDASGLLAPAEQRQAEVLNGIAYRASTGTFLLTGKYWPKLFEVVIEPAAK